MGKLYVDYSDLERASSDAKKAAEESDQYADAIQKHVVNPLSNIHGGQSNYTGVAVSLANAKIKQLRNNANWYRELSGKINTFGAHAESADKNVRTKLHSIQQEWYQNLSFIQKVMVNTYSVFSHTIGRTDIGKFIMSVGNVGSYFIERGKSLVQSVARWFQYGNGRYVLNIASAVFGIGAAIASLVVTCIAPNPFTLAIAVGGLVLAYKSVKGVLSMYDNFDALGTSETDPGLARYKGNTKTVLDFAKKHFHDKTIQKIAGGVDFVGTVAEIADTVLGFSKPLTDGGSYSLQNVIPNLKKNLGFGSEGWSLSNLLQKSTGMEAINSGKTAENTSNALQTAKNVKTITKDLKNGVKNLQTFNKVVNGEVKGGEEIAKTIGKYVPNVKDVVQTIEDLETIGKSVSAFH